ncbi:MAG: hypothetical protein ACJ76Z_05760 [Thermoleophilaceae bacterium]
MNRMLTPSRACVVLGVAFVAAVALLAPPVAALEMFRLPVDPFENDWVWSGSGVVLERDSHGHPALFTVRRGQRATRLTRFDRFFAKSAPPDEGTPPMRAVSFVVSSRLVAGGLTLIDSPLSGDDYVLSGQVAASARGGPLRLIERCRDRGAVPLAALGSTLAYTPARCDDAPDRIAIEDVTASSFENRVVLDPPTGSAFRVANDVSYLADTGLELAGAYVGALVSDASDQSYAHPRVAVYERRTGRPVYETTAGAGVVSFDLDADGSVAVVYNAVQNPDSDCGQQTVGWASPDSPVVHAIGPSCDDQPLIDRGRILYTRPTRNTTFDWIDKAHGADDVLAAVDGRPPAVLLSPARIVTDFDRGRLAFATPTCSLTEVTIARLAALRRSATPAIEHCSVHLLARRVELGTDGRLRIPLVCPLGCPGDSVLHVWDPARRRHLRFADSYGSPRYTFSMGIEAGGSPAPRQRFWLAPLLEPHDREWIRHRPSVRLTLQVSVAQPYGPARDRHLGVAADAAPAALVAFRGL